MDGKALNGSFENDKAMVASTLFQFLPVEKIDIKGWAKDNNFKIVDIYEGKAY